MSRPSGAGRLRIQRGPLLTLVTAGTRAFFNRGIVEASDDEGAQPSDNPSLGHGHLPREAGHPEFYSVAGGFGGYKNSEGRRDLNGWTNAGLPWTRKIIEGQVYIR